MRCSRPALLKKLTDGLHHLPGCRTASLPVIHTTDLPDILTAARVTQVVPASVAVVMVRAVMVQAKAAVNAAVLAVAAAVNVAVLAVAAAVNAVVLAVAAVVNVAVLAVPAAVNAVVLAVAAVVNAVALAVAAVAVNAAASSRIRKGRKATVPAASNLNHSSVR